MILKRLLLIIILCSPFYLFGEWGIGGYASDLMKDLMIVNEVNKRLNDRMPVYYNHILLGGYINMPSARMGQEGDTGFSFSYVPPYHNYNLRFQFLDRVEISGNYRVFKGVDDPILSPSGFGDKSDKGANVKFALLHPEDTRCMLPGIAIGFEDFIGTSSFESRYVVLTQVFPNWNFEASVGYGQLRLRKWFGGLLWIPFRKSCNPYLKDIVLNVEYDATRYKSRKREPHPDGRSLKSRINYGLKYRLWNFFDFSACYIRGEKFAFSAGANYNFGQTQGFFSKIEDPLPYTAPKNTHPLGPLRPEDTLMCDLHFPFLEQGFSIEEGWLSYSSYGNKILRLKVSNLSYRYQDEVRTRLTDLLAALIPRDITDVVLILVENELPVQEYHFPMTFVHMYGEKKVCPYEISILTPPRNVQQHCHPCSRCLYKSKTDWWNIGISPKTYASFGSAKGKIKGALGVHLGIDGYLWNDWYYSLLFGYLFYSDLDDVKGVDKLNPSQIINVRTDSVNYHKQRGITIDEAYLQKNWNLTHGWFGKFSIGLFEEMYGGVAGEVLYYPVNSCWAFGLEAAGLRKRTVDGIGFTDEIRKLEGFRPAHRKFRGSQYFANFYYNIENLDLEVHLKGGKFLANDVGVRTQLTRYYPSGMEVYFWYTYTDKKDFVNGKRYHDNGVGISLPLDILYTFSSRHRWGYGLSSWLRDVGAFAFTGAPLYHPIREARINHIR